MNQNKQITHKQTITYNTKLQIPTKINKYKITNTQLHINKPNKSINYKYQLK